MKDNPCPIHQKFDSNCCCCNPCVSGLELAQTLVSKFMQKAEQRVEQKPNLCSLSECAFRFSLIQEELNEYLAARYAENLTDIADAIGDLLYVVLGAACQHGINIAPIFEEIHRSNMTKFIDGHKNNSGKWIKGPSYTPANLHPILLAQNGNSTTVAGTDTTLQ